MDIHTAADSRSTTATTHYGSVLRAAAMIAGAAAIVLAVYHVVTPGSPGGAVYVTFGDYAAKSGCSSSCSPARSPSSRRGVRASSIGSPPA